MFSRRNRRPTSPELAEAWDCLDGGDVPGALRRLRQAPSAPLDEVATVVGRAAEAAGFDDLRKAATALAAHPGRVRPLYDYGYACVERGVSYLAIPALREAVRLAPGSSGMLRELVSAYEDEGRHRDAVDALLAQEDGLGDWPDRYLLVFNAVLAGDLELARRQRARLAAPADDTWRGAWERQNRVLERAATTGPVSPLDHSDLRGWQYVMGGTVLGTLSPHGYDVGMTGRYAWFQDSHDQCLQGLLRLKSVLAAAGVRPRSVSLLPDRGSRILGLAAAGVLGLPAEPFEAGREDTVVIAYDLNDTAGAGQGTELLGGALPPVARTGAARARELLDRPARRHGRQRLAAPSVGRASVGGGPPAGRRRGNGARGGRWAAGGGDRRGDRGGRSDTRRRGRGDARRSRREAHGLRLGRARHVAPG
ncbi:hypothetical protein ABZS61_33180 [Streptomyces sp. NPDC005566]|uniref:hypothetical protein n=1 Tax=Streptomyces sp. NPDC005566 TaxID=3156886 RepID=UPI0033AC3227